MTFYDASTIFTPASKEGLIGRGSFGAVRICKIPKRGIVAAKCISTSCDITKNTERCANEAKVLCRVQHPNILTFFGMTEWFGAIAIVTEYLSTGSLDSLLRNSKVSDLSWPLRLRMAYQLSEALYYIHNHKQRKSYVHGDVKPDNVLLANDLTVKLADFGSVNLMRLTNASTPSINLPPNKQHTTLYTAPEFLKFPEHQRVPAMDTYSYSMVLYELMTRTKIYSNATVPLGVLISVIIDKHQRPDQKGFQNIRQKLRDINLGIFDVLLDLMISCWDHIPENRPTTSKVRDFLLTKLKEISHQTINMQAANVEKLLDAAKPQYDEQNWVTLDKFSNPFEKVAYSNVAVSLKPSVESDLKEEEVELILNKDNCIRIREFSKKSGYANVVKKSEEIILEQFDLFVQEKKLDCLELSDLIHIIKSKQDQVLSSHASIFRAVTGWVHCDFYSRRQHFRTLFGLIDTQTLSKEFLSDVVLNEEMVTTSSECLKVIMLSVMPRVDRGLSSNEFAGLVMIRNDKRVLKYDIVKRQFFHMPKTTTSHTKGSAVSFNRQVFVIGGKCTKVVEMLDLQDAMPHWVKLASTNEHRWYGASATHGGYIYTCGGIGAFSSVERYNYKTNQWESSRLKDMKAPRHGHALVTVEGKIYAVGGGIGTERFSSIECFGAPSDGWCFRLPMKIGRQWLAAAELDNEIYAIGGWNNGYLTSVEKYNPQSDKWSEVSSLKKARFGHCACVVGRRIYVVGGENQCTVEVFDPDRNAWEIEASSPDLYDVDCVVPIL